MAAEETEDEKNVVPPPIDSSPSEEESSSHHSCSVHDENRPAGEGDESTALMESSEERTTPSPTSSKESHKKKKHNIWAPAVMVGFTFIFFTIELTYGFINQSIALLADAYHMLSDVMALTIAIICLWISKKASRYSTFGWVRAEVIGALFNGVWLLTMCYLIALESIGRLINPHAIGHPKDVLIVGTIGLFINIIGIIVFHKAGLEHGGHGHSHEGGGHGHSHSHKGGKHKKKKGKGECHDEPHGPHEEHGNGGHAHDDHGGHGHSHDHPHEEVEENRAARASSHASQLCHSNIALRMVNLDPEMGEAMVVIEEADPKIKDKKNLNMEGAFLHILTDLVGSVIVMITAATALFFPNFMGGYFVLYIDPILSLCLVVGMSWNAVKLVRQTFEIVLRLQPSFLDRERLTQKIEAIEGVLSVNNIHCWTLVANRHISTAEIEFDSASDFVNATPAIRNEFHRHGIHSLTIQPTFSSAVEIAE